MQKFLFHLKRHFLFPQSFFSLSDLPLKSSFTVDRFVFNRMFFSHIQNGKHCSQWEKLRNIVYLTSRCLRSAKEVCTLCALCTLFLIKRLRICSYSLWTVCVLVTVLISPSINICLFNSVKMCCLKQIYVRYV